MYVAAARLQDTKACIWPGAASLCLYQQLTRVDQLAIRHVLQIMKAWQLAIKNCYSCKAATARYARVW